MYTITPKQMQSLEKEYMLQNEISGQVLMERAALHVANEIKTYLVDEQSTIICFCGNGNNGADALCALRLLSMQNVLFSAIIFTTNGVPSKDYVREKNWLLENKVNVTWQTPTDAKNFEINKLSITVVVDALFGTGLSRPLQDEALEYCNLSNKLNNQGYPVISIDIPSGLNGENGLVLGQAIKATTTLCFHQIKQGLLLNDGMDYVGKIKLCDIDLPISKQGRVFKNEEVARFFNKRKQNSHKGDYGRVVILGGKEGMAGAVAFAAMAALRSGAGLVYVACPQKSLSIVQTLVPGAVAVGLNSNYEKAWKELYLLIEKADSIVVGCGLGESTWSKKILNSLIKFVKKEEKRIILDADALNIISKYKKTLTLPTAIVTPHPMEMARLCDCNIKDVLSNPVEIAKSYHNKTGMNVLLKGVTNVIYTKNDWGLTHFGHPALAKGGSGDVLSGILGAVFANKFYSQSVLEKMVFATALQGYACKIALKTYSEYGLLPSDVCNTLGMLKPNDFINSIDDILW